MNKIDLRSDTVTRPVAAMKSAMFNAEIGDDMMGEDPTVNRLESMVAELLGKEAAVFACSGTQSNQMGVRAHCSPGDELLINESGHIANFEGGAPAILSGVTVRPIPAPRGLLDVGDLEGKLRGNDQHFARTRLVCLENTTNLGGGHFYPLAQLQRVSQWARANSLKLHLDGARLFNAAVAGGYSVADVAACVDTISICFSKGLGCPMGSILVGNAEDIAKARRFRKVLGGALRQAGLVAAAAIYALENHVDRLAEDHANASLLAGMLQEIPGIRLDEGGVVTNLVFFHVDPAMGTAAQLAAALRQHGVYVGSMGGQRMRAVTHLDVNTEDVRRASAAIRQCLETGFSSQSLQSFDSYSR